jgi:hypothetical protein
MQSVTHAELMLRRQCSCFVGNSRVMVFKHILVGPFHVNSGFHSANEMFALLGKKCFYKVLERYWNLFLIFAVMK